MVGGLGAGGCARAHACICIHRRAHRGYHMCNTCMGLACALVSPGFRGHVQYQKVLPEQALTQTGWSSSTVKRAIVSICHPCAHPDLNAEPVCHPCAHPDLDAEPHPWHPSPPICGTPSACCGPLCPAKPDTSTVSRFAWQPDSHGARAHAIARSPSSLLLPAHTLECP